jgi:hypothetical protein
MIRDRGAILKEYSRTKYNKPIRLLECLKCYNSTPYEKCIKNDNHKK